MSFVTYTQLPNFPATDQLGPTAQRAKIGQWWVDYVGTPPTLAQVQAQAAPTAAQLLAMDRAVSKALLDNPDTIARLVVALAKQVYDDMTVAAVFKAKYPTFASWVTSIKSQADGT